MAPFPLTPTVIATCLLLLTGCGAGSSAATGPELRAASFSISDQAHDVESTDTSITTPADVDLVGVAARLLHTGVEVTVRYAAPLRLGDGVRARVNLVARSDRGREIWGTLDLGSHQPLALAPRIRGCRGVVDGGSTGTSGVTIVLSAACFQRPGDPPFAWVQLDDVESSVSWHTSGRIQYAYDRLYNHASTEDTPRLYRDEMH